MGGERLDISEEMANPPPLRNPMTSAHYGGVEIRLSITFSRRTRIVSRKRFKTSMFCRLSRIHSKSLAGLPARSRRGPDSTRRGASGTFRAAFGHGALTILVEARFPVRRPLGPMNVSSEDSNSLVRASALAIRTYGCQMNVHDSEKVATLLEEPGSSRARARTTPIVLVINTCSIRDKAEHQLYSDLGLLRNGRRSAPGGSWASAAAWPSRWAIDCSAGSAISTSSSAPTTCDGAGDARGARRRAVAPRSERTAALGDSTCRSGVPSRAACVARRSSP